MLHPFQRKVAKSKKPSRANLRFAQKSEKYEHVSIYRMVGDAVLYFRNCLSNNFDLYPSEREAALAVDRGLIASGKSPINILKKRSHDDNI